MIGSRFLSLCAVPALLFVSAQLCAQPAVAPRIVAPIDESRLTTLSGGISMRARAGFDRGQAPSSTQMSSVRLVLSRSPQQEAALEKFMAEQLDPASPNYRNWLTPDQFGKLYGPADSDIETLVTWLQSHGFTVQPVAPGRTSIAFSGSVSQLEAAFHTEIHSFNDGGKQFLANIANPRIPSALAPLVSGIAQLNTIRPRPHNALGRMGTYDPQQKHLIPADSYASSPTPFFTTGGGTSSDPYFLYLVPGDAATIYDTPNSFNARFSSGTSYNGTGVTIGIGGDALIQGSTVAEYRTRFLGNSTQPTITNVASDPAVTCSGTNCDEDEAYLDNEISGGLAPGATIHFYTAGNLSDAIEQAISDNAVDIFSLSFGECEAALPTADNQIINGWWQQAAAQGIAVTVSTGDSGSAGCDNDNAEQIAQYGLQVSGYASTPYNIAVGGTDFPGLASSFTTYVSTTNSTYYSSALGYIPESTWNYSTNPNTTLSADIPYVYNSTGNIVAGAGGASSCSTNANNATSTTIATCTSGYAKPSWQTGTGVPKDSVRDLPDVSLFASNGVDGAAWLVCTDDTFTESGVIYTANCAPATGGGFAFEGFGGTSTSAPAFAGVLALVQSSITGTPRLGQAARNLYGLYNGSHASAVFHDTTVGNISVPCTAGTPNCSLNTAGYDFLTGYNTGTGYDLATGLGSVDVTQLINFWSSANGARPTVSVILSASTVTTNQSLTVTGSVTGSAGTATGAVTLTTTGYSGTYTSSFVTLDSSGNYSITVPSSTLKVGTDTLTVNYTGDSNYEGATATATVTVNGLTPTVTVTPSVASQAANVALTVTAQVSGIAATPTGTVTLSSGAYSSTAQTLSSGGYIFTIPAGTLGAGTNAINVSYSGDSTYLSGTGSATVTLTKATPTVRISTDTTSVGPSYNSLNVGVYVDGGAAAPAGSVSLTATGGYNSGACALVGSQSPTACTFNIPVSSLPNGTDTLTASYSGSSVFNAATGTDTVSVHVYTPTMTVNAPTTISTGSTLQITFTVNGGAGNPTPTGNINVSGLQSYMSSCTLSSGSCTAAYAPGTVSSGTYNLSIAYSGDSNYNPLTQTASIVVTKSSVTIAVSPSASSTPARSALTVTATVAGGAAGTPTGAVTLSGGGYTSPAQTLSAGAYTFTIPAGSLSVGQDTLNVSYSGDNNYSAGSGYAPVTVTPSPTPAINVTPASTGIDTGQSLAVAVNVAGAAGAATPTGTVTLTSGSYISSATSLSSGAATINIPANSLAAGSDTLSVAYSGDALYNAASGSASVTVTASAFTLSGATPTAVAPGASTTATVTVSSNTNYSGSVALTCALTSSPTGAVDSPTCSVTGSPITLSSSTTSATATVTFSTTAASAVRGGSGVAGLAKAGGATLLAFLVFLGIPARHRAWRTVVGMLVLIVALGALSACGGGSGGGGGGGGNSNPGTTTGSYTFTITGTGNPSVSSAPSTTVTLTVD